MIVGSRPPFTAPVRPPALRSAAQTYAANLAGAVLSLANVLIVARVLGAEGRGHIAFLTAVAWFTANLSTFGVQEANSNFAAAHPRLRRSLATNSCLMAVALGMLTIGVLALLETVFPEIAGESDRTLLWMTLGFLPILILQPFLRFLIQADYGFAVTNMGYLVPPVLSAAMNGVLAAVGVLTVGTAVGVWLAGQTLTTALFAWYIARRLAGFGRPDAALARRTLTFGVKAHAGRVMLLGNYRLDQWLLGAIAGPRELGLYSVAVAWAEALWYLPTTLSAVQRPDLVRARLREAARQAARIFRVAILLTAVCALAMIAAAPFLCATVFGEEFRGSVDDLRVLVAGAFGVVAVKLFGNALVARRRPGLQSVGVGAGFVCTVVLDIVLIPPLGGLGAALASTLAYSAAGAVMGAMFVRALGAGPSELLPRIGELAWFAREVRKRWRRSPAPTQPEQIG
jgi:O-antigen/teichoic acid export membrane protein